MGFRRDLGARRGGIRNGLYMADIGEECGGLLCVAASPSHTDPTTAYSVSPAWVATALSSSPSITPTVRCALHSRRMAAPLDVPAGLYGGGLEWRRSWDARADGERVG